MKQDRTHRQSPTCLNGIMFCYQATRQLMCMLIFSMYPIAGRLYINHLHHRELRRWRMLSVNTTHTREIVHQTKRCLECMKTGIHFWQHETWIRFFFLTAICFNFMFLSSLNKSNYLLFLGDSLC